VKKIRIAFVASTFVVGGAERVTSSLVFRLPRDRFETKWFFLRGAGELGRELLRAGQPGLERVERGRLDPLVGLRLAAHFRRWRPDVVFCMDHHNAMLWGRVAGVLAGASACVVASHSTGLFGKRRSMRWSDRWLMEFTHRVVALSRTHARYLRDVEGVAAGKIAVIENGVDIDVFCAGDRRGARAELGIGDGVPVVLMVAALRPEKAHDALIEAAALLWGRGRCPLFLVAGDGARRGELEALARERGVDGVVRFLGARDDVARLLHAADVLVLPSHPVVETLPLAVLEAMAAGVPVVASRVGSVPELVDDGVNGILIAPADPVELARAIGYIVDNPDAAAAMARSARERVVARYSLDRMARSYQRLFEDLVA
jgi:glycosyltransferase involved in cell wall biosynthesis